MLILILLHAAFLLPPGVGAGAGEIIRGREAQPHSRPYMAFVNIKTGRKEFRCGGFLIRKDVVVTAAHCNCKLGTITVLLGAHNVAIREPQRQEIPVRRQIQHPDYNSQRLDNDIMLLQLSSNATLTKTVSIINLPPAPHSIPPRPMCSVAGWGMTSLTNTTNKLQEVNLTVISNQICNRRYPYYNASIKLCAGDPQDKKTFYLGDSGGPLVCNGVPEGIVSHCIRNSTAPPGVYTRISHFLPWINYTITHF